MKTTANSRSAFLVPRVALGVGLCLAGMSLGLGALSESITQQSSSDQEHAAHSSVKPLNAHSPSSIDWPQYGFDPDHTSFNPLETLLSTDTAPLLQVVWQYFFPCSTYSSPVVVDGVLYTGSYCGDFEALDAVTGETLWSKRSLGGVIDSAAVANGIVYVTAKEAATVYAFNASTGAAVWTAHTGDWIYSNPTVWNGIVFVGAADGKLYALDGASGTTLWTTAALSIIESPSVADGIAYVGASDGHLYSFDAATGASVWTADTGGSNATPAVSNGVVYEGGLDDHLYAFNAATGALLWTGTNGGSSPAVANGVVYVGSAIQKQLYAFDADGCGLPSCSPIWTATTKGIVTAAPAVANGVVYAGAWDRYLYAFDAAQGSRLWTYTATSYYSPGCLCPSPSVVNGMLYVGVTFGYQLYAFNVPQLNPIPFISQPLVPDAITPGGSDFILTVNGTGFLSGATVNWNGTARVTTYVSNSQLTASISASDIAIASTAAVTVVNPTPGGGISNVVYFPITIPTSSLSFATSDYATGMTPNFVATGDFNTDGKLDLAVTNFSSNTVSVFIGKDDGTFQPRADYATGGTSSSVAVGDFNGDGKLDLAVANGAGSTGNIVSVLLGNGDGTFQTHVDYQTGRGSLQVAVGDFNGDGKLDLAVGNYGPDYRTGSVSILLGNGDGTFQPHVDYPAGVNPVGVLVGDFNRDSKLDLAVMNNNPPFGVSILLGNGDGSFPPPVHYNAGTNPRVGAAADFNSDGYLDLAVANFLDNNLSILLGTANGTFQVPVNYSVGTNPNGLRAGDLNGDGKLDLVTANYASNNTSVLLGNGDGSFQHHVDYGSGTGPAQVTIGDFNSDGMLDLSVANQTANAMSVFLQTPVITQGCLPPPVGLVSWWSGDRTADDVQGANNGALLNGASFAKGMVGPGFRLDGIDDWVTIPNSSSLHPTQLTLDAWIYLTGNENLPRHVIGKDAVSSEREYSLGVNYANKVEGFVVVPSGLKVVTGVTDVSLNSWYHIAMTYDGAQARLYVDGVQEAVTDATGNIVPTKSPVGIGGDPFGEFTNGIVDEAQIFSRALSSSEIQSMYEAGAAGQCKPGIFVFSINPSYTVAHSQYLVTTSVAIQDTSGIAISGATANVKVRFPSGSEPIFPAQTDESGNATFSFYTSETGFYKFKVIRVSHPVRDYDPSLNVETSDTLVIP